MILPTKHIPPHKALISISAEVFALIGSQSTTSSLWNQFQNSRRAVRKEIISFDWFILALDFLYLIGAIEEDNGLLIKVKKNVD
jgi:hypothetical protein